MENKEVVSVNINDYEKIADELSKKEVALEKELIDQIGNLELLESEKQKIDNPDQLGEVILDVVWEQFLLQMASVAGEDFIKENRGLTLDLRKSSHIQTTDNFAKGKIATHNTEIDYQKRYDDWQGSFEKNKNGEIKTHKNRAGKEVNIVKSEARKPFDKNRPTGSAKNKTDMDHTVSAAEIIRDPGINAHMSKEEQIDFANSDKNLNEMTSSWNRSKGDLSTKEWLENPNSKGQIPEEVLDGLDEKAKKKLLDKDKEARKELEERKSKGEQRSIDTGKESLKQEGLRIGKSVVKAVIMQLLADLIRELIGKLIEWFRSKERNINTLLEKIKSAIVSFVTNLKNKIVNVAETVFTTIITAIFDTFAKTIIKVYMIIKQGYKSLVEAINYLNNPENKDKPIQIKMVEIGKIVVAGLTGIGALLLGESIEKLLAVIPGFSIEIPIIGSLANIIGVFMGATISGVVGAIVLDYLSNLTIKIMKQENTDKQIDQANGIIIKQHELRSATIESTNIDISEAENSIASRHMEAGKLIKEAIESAKDCNKSNHQKDFEELDYALDSLLE